MKNSTMRNLPADVKDELDKPDVDRLKATVVESATNLARIEYAAEHDEAYLKLKQDAKDAGQAYADGKKYQAAKLDYSLHLLEGKGVLDLAGDLSELLAGMHRDGMDVSVSIGGQRHNLTEAARQPDLFRSKKPVSPEERARLEALIASGDIDPNSV